MQNTNTPEPDDEDEDPDEYDELEEEKLLEEDEEDLLRPANGGTKELSAAWSPWCWKYYIWWDLRCRSSEG